MQKKQNTKGAFKGLGGTSCFFYKGNFLAVENVPAKFGTITNIRYCLPAGRYASVLFFCVRIMEVCRISGAGAVFCFLYFSSGISGNPIARETAAKLGCFWSRRIHTRKFSSELLPGTSLCAMDLLPALGWFRHCFCMKNRVLCLCNNSIWWRILCFRKLGFCWKLFVAASAMDTVKIMMPYFAALHYFSNCCRFSGR